MKKLVLIFNVLLLSACSSTNNVEYVKSTNGDKNALVVSILSSEMHYYQVGLTAFNNNSDKVNVDWDINRYLENKITNVIASRFNILPVSNELRELVAVDENYYSSGHKLNLDEPMKLKLEDLEVDVVVVAYDQFRHYDPFFETNRSIKNFGIYKRTVLNSSIIEYATMLLVFFDAKTGERILSNGLLGYNENGVGGYVTNSPSQVDIQSFEELSDVDLAALRVRITKLYDELVTRSLAAFGFDS